MPLAIDLFCGLGGWTEGLIAEGYSVVGFDNERHAYGKAKYPAQLVIQDVLTLHGSQLKDAALIVGSSPCQEFSYRAMPWKRAKALPPPYLGMELFNAQFRLQREASEAAGRYIPLVVENVCGAQKWVGRARWHYGSFYLWGDVPALMPITKRHTKGPKAGTGNQLCCVRVDQIQNDGEKVRGFRFDGSGRSFQTASVKATKNDGGSWFAVAHNTTSGVANDPVNDAFKGSDGGWFNDNKRSGAGTSTGRLSQSGSKSSARKAASAHIAKIPLALARHIGRAWYPC